MAAAQRIFISYTHDSDDHKERVLVLAERLRSNGLDVHFDQWVEAPGHGWPAWMTEQLELADHVLVVCTEAYGKGRGSAWEVRLITDRIYLERGYNIKFIPILLGYASEEWIPVPLRTTSIYRTDLPKDFENLLRRLTESATAPSEPRDPSIRLEKLYDQRESALLGDEDTTVIDGQILDLKREIRRGPQLKPGDFLADGRYKLGEVIGQGGFAEVWKAVDRKRRKLVAIKVLHGQFAKDRTRRERFFHGARQMQRLDHPNILRIVDIDAGEQGDEGWYFFVMEYAEGGDLWKAVSQGNLTRDEKFDALGQVADALEYAHGQGVVHRDIKPANILLKGTSRAFLTDFDLVQALDSTGGTRTQGMGSFLFAAPEAMIDASRADARCDQYSLASTTVSVLLGKSLDPVFMRFPEQTLTRIDVTEDARGVLERALDWDVNARYASVGEFWKALLGGPSWASDSGVDGFGRWATFEVNGVEQRMRWIDPGKFWMGSPEDEVGRWDNEGPRYEVELTQGFWLAETPCTQALWEVVMGDNPSGFKGAVRPVENVSWNDCQEFLAELTQKVPGLDATLPTEAQWEYACRAGTRGPRWTDDLKSIAWFHENSGGKTHPVALKAANPWGLFDKLGNVWEWCADQSGRYDEGAVVDPSGPDHGTRRVLRGGSWRNPARYVRAAYRYAYDPGSRSYDLGFRLAVGPQ